MSVKLDERGNIIASRGDTIKLRVPIVDSNGAPLNCTGASFVFTVKNDLDDSIANAVFQLTNPVGNGIDDSNASAGIVIVTVPNTYTQAIFGKMVCDLEMTLAGVVTTVLGPVDFIIRKDVTTPGAPPAPPGPVILSVVSIAVRDRYIQDFATGLFWRLRIVNGQEAMDGPYASIPQP